MLRNEVKSRRILMLIILTLLLIWATQAVAQTEPEPEVTDPEEVVVADPTVPPAYIAELIEQTDLTPEQVELMRLAGTGWGEIRISTKLAERIVAETAETDTPLTFDQAMDVVAAARAEGLGYGEIAAAHNVKVGQLVGNGHKIQEPGEGEGLEAQESVQAGEAVQTKAKKRGFFARLGGFLGFGKSKKAEKAPKPTQVTATNRNKVQKVEKVAKVQKLERPERPSRPEKPEKPEKPERPERPEKPEKPERGPRR